MITEAPALLAPIFAQGGERDTALTCGDAALDYGALRRSVEEMREALCKMGVGRGDRVALCRPKNVATVVAILAVLASGAAYAPLDRGLSPAQLGRVLADLRPRLLIAEATAIAALGALTPPPETEPFAMWRAVLHDAELRLEAVGAAPGAPTPVGPDDLAAILYTSGSTGEPKGIMLSHENIESFVDWGAREFEIRAADRLANHAPLCFDLSIFDLFCGLGRGASVHLLDETTTRFPGAIRRLVQTAGVTVWYSAPTALVQLQERGALEGLDSLRLVLFAGEVFPTPALRRLMSDVPAPLYANLYGPTETNVCAFHRLPGPPASDFEMIPIGRPCDHLEVRVLGPGGTAVRKGETGEICVAGPAVTRGYWARPEATEAARVAHWRGDSYRTGDYGYERPDGALMFVGRRDQQAKVRGRRIELLALESALNAHPNVREAAALFLPEDRSGGALAAYLVARRERPTDAEIRDFVVERLPPHYAPDLVEWLDEMPRTANGKCDRQRLRSLARRTSNP